MFKKKALISGKTSSQKAGGWRRTKTRYYRKRTRRLEAAKKALLECCQVKTK